MLFEPDSYYHLYNRSNRQLPVFYSDANYTYFLKKVEIEWKQYFDILAYCLMPTHFHFIILSNQDIKLPAANYAVGKLLSSYTRAINKQQHTHGSLFQGDTKNDNLFDESEAYQNKYNTISYMENCFKYIHKNPIKDGLVSDLADWEFSSYHDYAGLRTNSICNLELTEKLLGFNRGKDFIKFLNVI